MARIYLAAVLAAAPLAGCDSLGGSSGQCDSKDTEALAIKVLTDAVEDQVASAKDGNGSVLVVRSKIRAALKQINFAINDVRTTKSDPDSSAEFCTGTVAIGFPKEMLD